ncbi:MAG: cation transporter [Eubacterium sp.]|nr:cation transporter [Eubacterium sp.]
MAQTTNHIKEQLIEREKQIMKTSLVGIGTNVLLVAFKAVIGLLTNSIAIVLDAINNLSDALSSLITIIGMKLAGKPADKKHPLGYGRIEYLTSAVIAVLVLYAGVSSLVSSVKQILHPEEATYSTVSLVIVGVAVAVKLLLGTYFKRMGKKTASDALSASGADALFDAVISASTVLAAVIYLVWGVSLEAYLGVLISLVIIKSGVDMLRETLSKILGERPDADLSKGIKKTVCSVDGVRGAYDLVLNNYGPNNYLASVHVEIPDTMTADQIDAMTREIQRRVLAEHGIYVTAVSIYSYNTKSEKAAAIRETVEKIIYAHPHILQTHGFYFDEAQGTVSIDFIADFDNQNPHLLQDIEAEIQSAYPEYTVDIAMDTDISD